MTSDLKAPLQPLSDQKSSFSAVKSSVANLQQLSRSLIWRSVPVDAGGGGGGIIFHDGFIIHY